ncbi:MAG: FkbM family methyltransferase [Acidobacteria bacterium]|nr:FkbM family methyltransferase [Acidobacteriota bacterium]
MILFNNSAWLAGLALVVLAAAAAALILIRARRAGLNLHRQIADVRDEIRAARDEVQAARCEVRGTRGELQANSNEAASTFALLRDRANDTNLRAVQIQEALHRAEIGLDRMRHVEAGFDGLDNRIEQFHSRLEALRDAVRETSEFIARRPSHVLPVAAAALASRTDAELLEMAASIAILRPLVPFPRWRHDADLHNPDLTYQLRRWFWLHFNQCRAIAPIVVPWYGGTRLRTFLGTDLSSQIYIAGCMEPNEFAFLDRILRPGMTFLDAGANEGIYTVFAAARVGREGSVLAFEPSSRELQRLEFNLQLNELNVQVLPVALAETEGKAKLKVGGYEHAGHNTLGDFVYDIEPGGTELVDVRRLDDIIREQAPARIDVIKMDIEGAESRLARGANQTLRKYRPILLFEAEDASLRNQGSSREELVELLRALEYTMYVFDRATGLPRVAESGEYDHNMIAAPMESPLPPAAAWPLPESAPK